MNKIGEVAFPKRLYEVIDTSIGFKVWACAFVILFFSTLFFIAYVITSQGFDILTIAIGTLAIIFEIKVGILPFIFLVSPLKFRFYEEGMAINNCFVGKEHMLGYKKGKDALFLFIETSIQYKYQLNYYFPTKIALPLNEDTAKLIPFLEKYKLLSNYEYQGSSTLHQKIDITATGGNMKFLLND